jgi:hypothetical protein
MDYISVILFIFALLGLTAGAFMVARSPSFWFGMGEEVFKRMIPIILKRMPPEEEEAWRKCQLRGGKWNFRTKKCE